MLASDLVPITGLVRGEIAELVDSCARSLSVSRSTVLRMAVAGWLQHPRMRELPKRVRRGNLPVTTRLPRLTLDTFRAHAAEHGLSYARLLEVAIVEWFERSGGETVYQWGRRADRSTVKLADHEQLDALEAMRAHYKRVGNIARVAALTQQIQALTNR